MNDIIDALYDAGKNDGCVFNLQRAIADALCCESDDDFITKEVVQNALYRILDDLSNLQNNLISVISEIEDVDNEDELYDILIGIEHTFEYGNTNQN